jgi:hypothetical protein
MIIAAEIATAHNIQRQQTLTLSKMTVASPFVKQVSMLGILEQQNRMLGWQDFP